MTAVTTAAGGLLLLACCRRIDTSALSVWAVAMIVAATGLVLAATAPAGNQVADAIATMVLLTASGLFWTATRVFRGAQVEWLWLAYGPIVWLGAGLLHAPPPFGVGTASMIGAVYTCASVRELERARDQHLPSLKLATAMMAAHAAVYLVRGLLAASNVLHPGWIATPWWVVPALIVEATVHINGTALVLVALLLERHESQNNQILRLAAYVDGLTGIANRRQFDEYYAELLDGIASDRRHRASLVGLIMIDVDLFKSINDTAGHHDGDRILREVAQVIAQQIRSPRDLVARYGGEEFVVLLPRTTEEEAARIAERIRAAVAAAAIPHPATGGLVTVSAGVQAMSRTALVARRDALIDYADQALYHAKRQGRNRVEVWSDLATGRHRHFAPAASV